MSKLVKRSCGVQAIGDLVEDGGVIQVNDKKLLSTMHVKLKYSDLASMQQ